MSNWKVVSCYFVDRVTSFRMCHWSLQSDTSTKSYGQKKVNLPIGQQSIIVSLCLCTWQELSSMILYCWYEYMLIFLTGCDIGASWEITSSGFSCDSPLYFLVSIMSIFSNGAHEQVGLKNGKFFLFANNIVSRLRSTHRPILDLEVASFAFSRVSIGFSYIW